MLIGAIVYGAKYSETISSSLGIHLFVAFGLVVVAGVFSIIAGVMFVIAGNRQM